MLVLGACGQVAADILRVAAPTSVSVLMNGPTSWCGGMCAGGGCFVAGGDVGGFNMRECAGERSACLVLGACA